MDPIATMLAPHIEAIGQAETARRCGVTEAQLSRWLGGRKTITLDTLMRLVEGLGLEIVIRPREISRGPTMPRSTRQER